MSKYKQAVYNLLSKDTIKSTNEILTELEEKTKKTISWHILHRDLMELASEGKAEALKAKAGFFWKKK